MILQKQCGSFSLSSVSSRVLRIQKEKEEAESRKLEAAVKQEQEHQAFVKEKEREVLQLQVQSLLGLLCFFSVQTSGDLAISHFHHVTGGCKELHQLGELGSANRRSSGYSKELQLCH